VGRSGRQDAFSTDTCRQLTKRRETELKEKMILGIDTPQLLNTLRLYSIRDRLPGGGGAIETYTFDAMGQSEKLQSPDTEPVQIELIPTQTMTR